MDIKGVILGALIGALLGAAIAWVAKPDPEPKHTVPSKPRETADRPAERPTGPKPMYTGEDIDKARQAADMAARTDERRKMLDEQNEDLKAARAKLEEREKKIGELEKKVSDLQAQVEEAKKGSAAPPAKKAPISWGKAGEVKEVGEANWPELSAAMGEIIKSLGEILAARKEGKEPSPESMKNIQKHNQKLIDYYVKVLRKLPTHMSANGEFVHPINTANMIAAALQAAGKPLSEAQTKQVVTLGEEYEAGWDKLQAGYDASTLKLEKVVDELELKQKFYDGMIALLQPDQREVVIDPAMHDYMQLDMYSPSLALVQNLAPVYKPTLEEVRTTLIDEFSKEMGINKDLVAAQGFIVDTWFSDCGPLLDPRTEAEIGMLKTQECIKYGRAQIKAFKALIEALRPDEKQLGLMRDFADIAILRVRKAQ